MADKSVIMTTESGIKYFENREEWRRWLTDNFDTAREIWFVFPHKSSGRKSIVYNDAVEEALCFDWIDSTIRPLDAEHKIQRFTPRNPKSAYSQANRERLKWLLENGMIHPKFEEKIQREQIIRALRRNNGRRREAAAELFMSERTLYRKIKELGIEEN